MLLPKVICTGRAGAALLAALLVASPDLAIGRTFPNASCPDSVTIKQLWHGTNMAAPAPVCKPFAAVNTTTGSDTVMGIGGIVIGIDAIASAYGFYMQGTSTVDSMGIDLFTGAKNLVADTGYNMNLARGDSVVVEWAAPESYQGSMEVLSPNNNQSQPNFIIRKVSAGNALPPMRIYTTHDLRYVNDPTSVGPRSYLCGLVRVNGPLVVGRKVGTYEFMAVDPTLPTDSIDVYGASLTSYAAPNVGTVIDWVQGIAEHRTPGTRSVYELLLRDGADLRLSAPPSLADAHFVASNQIRVVFDRDVTVASATNITNYALGSFGEVQSAVMDGSAAVVLTVLTALSMGQMESVTVNGVVASATGLVMTVPQMLNFVSGLLSIRDVSAPSADSLLGAVCRDRSRFAGSGGQLGVGGAGSRLAATGVCSGVFGGLSYFEDADAASSGDHGGLAVTGLPVAPTVGHAYTLAGAVQEYFGETRLLGNGYLVDLGARTLPAPATQQVRTFALDTCLASNAHGGTGYVPPSAVLSGEDFEGMYVKLSGVMRVVRHDLDSKPLDGFHVAGGSTYSDTLFVQNFAGALGAADSLNPNYPSEGAHIDVAGVLRYENGSFRVCPRTSGDILGSAPPFVVDAYFVEPGAIRVLFDRAVTSATATSIANYSLQTGGAISGIAMEGSSAVRIVLQSAGISGRLETLTCSGISDALTGTLMPSQQTRSFITGILSARECSEPDAAPLLGSPCVDRSRFAGLGGATAEGSSGPRLSFGGVCTGVLGSRAFFEDVAPSITGDHGGLVVRDMTPSPTPGHSYVMAGSIRESFGETVLSDVVMQRDDGASSAPSPLQIVIRTLVRDTCEASSSGGGGGYSPPSSVPSGEDFEGMLVKVTEVQVVRRGGGTVPADGWYVAGDNPGYRDTLFVQNLAGALGTAEVTNPNYPPVNELLDIVGVMHYESGSFHLCPRSPSDVIDIGTYPPPARPDISSDVPPGWSNSLVPRSSNDATTTSCPEAVELFGDSTATFLNWAVGLSGADTVVTWRYDVLVDGAVRSSFPAAGCTHISDAGTVCGTATEGNILNLSAPQGLVFTAVEFASYGTPTGTCQDLAIGGCHATNSVGIVEALALGSAQCSITAANSVFGDPCVGTSKRLAVRLRYGTSRAIETNLGPVSIAGGWHTLKGVADASQNVTESNESNNSTESQWLWRPSGLRLARPVIRSAPPAAGSLAHPNCDAFQVGRDPRYGWVVSIGGMSVGDDYDLVACDDYTGSGNGLSHNIGSSLTRGSGTDFVVGTYLATPNTLYPTVRRHAAGAGGATYAIDYADARLHTSDTDEVMWTNVVLPSGRIADVFEVFMIAGVPRYLALKRAAGVSDLAFEVMAGGSGGVFGRSASGGKGSSVAFSEALDTLLYVPSETGWHPVVVFRTSSSLSDSVSYSLQVQHQGLLAVDGPPTPSALGMSRPFPNPASDGVQFDLALPRSSSAQVAVFDVLGRQVRLLLNGSLDAGVHHLAWDARDPGGRRLAPGLYLIRVRVGSWGQTRGVVLR